MAQNFELPRLSFFARHQELETMVHDWHPHGPPEGGENILDTYLVVTVNTWSARSVKLRDLHCSHGPKSQNACQDSSQERRVTPQPVVVSIQMRARGLRVRDPEYRQPCCYLLHRTAWHST